MVIRRGELWWAELPEPRDSGPGYMRPVLIIQSTLFNRVGLRTTIAVMLTTNLRLADAGGNVLLPKSETGLPQHSVANVTQIFTLDKGRLRELVGPLPRHLMEQVEKGLRLVLEL